MWLDLSNRMKDGRYPCTWGRSVWLDLSIRTKDVKRRLSHVNAPQKSTSAVEDFRNQLHRRTHSVDSQPLFPVLPVIAHKQHGHGSRDGTYTWARQHGLPLTNADLVTATAECQIGQLQRPTLSSCRYDILPSGDQSVTWWQVGYAGPLPPWKRQHFILSGVELTLIMDFPFLRIMLLPKPPSRDLQNIFSISWYFTQDCH